MEQDHLSDAVLISKARNYRQLMDSEDAAVRALGAQRLGELGPAAHPYLERLIAAFGDPVQDVGDKAQVAVSRVGMIAVPQLVQALRDENAKDEVRRRAASLLGCFRKEAAKRKDDATAASVEKALVSAIRCSNDPVACMAVNALASTRDKRFIALWIGVLQEKKQGGLRRCEVIRALYALGAEAASAVPALLDIWSRNGGCRDSAADALAAIAPKDERTLAALRAVLKDRNEDIDVRRAAARAIGAIGAHARRATDEMLDALHAALGGDPFPGRLAFVETVTLALVSINAEDASTPILTRIIKNEQYPLILRGTAADALGRLARPSPDPVLELLLLLARLDDDEKGLMQKGILKAVGKLGPAGRERIPELQSLLRSSAPDDAALIQATINKLRSR